MKNIAESGLKKHLEKKKGKCKLIQGLTDKLDSAHKK